MLNGRENPIADKQIENTGFFGAINIGDFQKQRAIPLQIPLELIESVLVYAIQSVEFDLNIVSQRYQKQGIKSVDDIQSPTINGKNFEKILFEKAVFARAKQELLPEFATLSARELHEKRDIVAEQKQLQAEAVQAIRQLKGKGRGTVDLI
ncbi:head completion/stabilization protein [Histophilus somni]|uniref:head completion/stabilization protein n=1 Tax=Histophilus somni TaxID=731 RepID=UPI00201EEE5C|nr:head completion/stabilization protein [Histophilus somni]